MIILKYSKWLQTLCVILFVFINVILFAIVITYYDNMDLMNIVFVVGVIHTLAFNRAQKDFVMMNDSEDSNNSDDNV